MPLTGKQQAIWDLAELGKTRAQIAAEIGISVPVVAKTLAAIRTKLGIVDAAAVTAEQKRVENRLDPGKVAAVLDAASDPEAKLRRIRAVAEAEGLPAQVTAALLKRWSTRYLGAKTEMRNLKTGELLRLVNERLDLTLGYMDEFTAAGASHRDLGLVAAALIEKRQLLRGEPTQIISHEERKSLNQLLPLAIAEAQRRGLVVQGTVTEKVVEPI